MWILLLTCFLYFCYYRHHCCEYSTTYQDALAPHLGMTLHHMEILVEMAAKNCCLILGKMILHQMEILVHIAVRDCCFVLENPIMKYVCVILYSKKQMTCYVLCNAYYWPFNSHFQDSVPQVPVQYYFLIHALLSQVVPSFQVLQLKCKYFSFSPCMIDAFTYPNLL